MSQRRYDRIADNVVHTVEGMIVDGPKLLSIVWAGMSSDLKATLRVLIRGAVIRALNEEDEMMTAPENVTINVEGEEEEDA